MAFLLAGEIGGAISGLLAEMGFSGYGAAAATGAATGTITSTIDQKIKDGLDSAAKNIIGEEKVNIIEQSANDVKDNYINALYSIWTQDPKYLVEAKKQKQQENLSKALEKTEEDNTENVDNNCKCDVDRFMDDILNSEDPGFSDLKDNSMENKKQEPDGAISQVFSSKELAQIIVEHSSEIARTKTIDGEQIVKLVGTDVNKYTLLERLTEFYKNSNIPTDEQYLQVQQVYNGRKKDGTVLSPSDVTVVYDREYQGLSFSINDEVGQLVTLKETKGFSLPAIYGVFGGPMSKNNALPIDTPDTFFMMHDSDYGSGGGYFNSLADMKLVSRLNQSKQTWPSDKISLLNSIVIYFSTFGLSLAKLKGSLSGDVAIKPIPDLTKDDIYPVVNPEALTYTDEVYIQKRFEFYRDFEDDIKTTVTSSSSMFNESGWLNNENLLNEFDNLEIVLL